MVTTARSALPLLLSVAVASPALAVAAAPAMGVPAPAHVATPRSSPPRTSPGSPTPKASAGAGPGAAAVGVPARASGETTAAGPRQGAAPTEPARPLAPQIAEAVASAIEEEMSQRGIPGLSVAIGERGELRFTAGYGLADVENEVEAGAETVYRLASVSKPMTAVATLRLVQKGQLDLDLPVWSYCSAYPAKPWPVTARELLCHQGGVRSYRTGEQPPVRHYSSLAEGLVLFKDDALAFEPGTSVLYSTYAYSLLGCALEGASGRGFAELLREEVFSPSGMTNTQPDDARIVIPHRAGGYVRTETGELLNSALADTSYKVPGGGLCGTAPDAARFGLALVSGRLLTRPLLQQMLTPQKTRTGQVTGFGLGITLTGKGRKREAWHNGGQERVSTVLYTQPDSGLVVALLSNLEGVGTPLLQLARRIADRVQPERAGH
jgi:serine beta-lactamase-like protein LACTB